MNTVDDSHLEVIKQHLENNPDHEFKMRKFKGQWYLGVFDMYDETGFTIGSASSFAEAVKNISNLLSHMSHDPI